MVKVYQADWLGYEHLRSTSELGQKCLPQISLKSISESVLMFQKESNDVERLKPEMIDIVCDGIIDPHEEMRWQNINKELKEFVGAALSIVFHAKKKTSLDGHLEKVSL